MIKANIWVVERISASSISEMINKGIDLGEHEWLIRVKTGSSLFSVLVFLNCKSCVCVCVYHRKLGSIKGTRKKIFW